MQAQAHSHSPLSRRRLTEILSWDMWEGEGTGGIVRLLLSLPNLGGQGRDLGGALLLLLGRSVGLVNGARQGSRIFPPFPLYIEKHLEASFSTPLSGQTNSNEGKQITYD